MFSGETKITGLFGDPVYHSLSPQIQNAAFQAKDLDFMYIPFGVPSEDLASAVRAILPLGMAGVNITAPHKEAVLVHLDELSPEGEMLKAVNTVICKDGKLKGYNTDVDGFLYLLRNMAPFSVKGKKVCLLGAGGAARAVSLALAKAGASELVIVNRTINRGKALLEMLCERWFYKEEAVSLAPLKPEVFPQIISDCDLIINSLSIDPQELGFINDCKKTESLKAAIDLRYSPAEPSFLRWASQNGCRVANGLDMLLGQGAKAFELFTGQEAPLSAMEKSLSVELARV